MRWWNGESRGDGGRHSASRLPPSLNSQTRSYSRGYGGPARGARSQRDSGGWPVSEDADFGGWNAASEKDVFASALR
jgi:hypothetical protein